MKSFMQHLDQLPRPYVILLIITSIVLPILLILGTIYLLTLGPDIGVAGVLLMPLIISGSILLTPIIILVTLGSWLMWLYFGRDALRNAKPFTYQIYEPAFLPEGYSSFKEKPYINKDEPQNYRMRYRKTVQARHGDDAMILEINQFAVPPRYRPPNNCTYYSASRFGDPSKIWPCELVGKTAGGTDIYISKQLPAAYGQFNGTLVTVQWEHKESQLINEEILQIFGSMKPMEQ
jgi:hypothetical protein